MHALIFADQKDDHLPLVLPHLSVDHTLIDVRQIAKGEHSLTYVLGDAEVRVVYDGQPIEGITAVWSRQLSLSFEDDGGIDPRYREYCRHSWRELTEAFAVQFENALWVSPLYAARRANRKILQIVLARKLGLNVPETIQTSDPHEAKAFVDARIATIVKPFMSQIESRAKGGGRYFFASKVHRGEALDYHLLPLAPLIFQEAIDPVADIRVVVIGDKVFAAKIVTDEENAARVRDWRIAQYDGKLTIEPYDLPEDVSKRCVRLIKKLGLAFGAIDLILDKKGRLWFLENNTTGAWGFLERATGLPIGKALADMLSAGKRS